MARIKTKKGENLTATYVERVISLLEQDNPITKKAACEILNINYNTTRLNRVIQEYKDKLEYASNRRKQLRNKPITLQEEKFIVSNYLIGESISYLTEYSYRSIAVVKNVLIKYGIPLRDASNTYKNPPVIDEAFIKEDYNISDLVYAVKYDCPAYITKVKPDPMYGTICRVRLVGPNRQSAWQAYFELIDLTKVQTELKIVLDEIDDDTIRHEIATAIINSRKGKNK